MSDMQALKRRIKSAKNIKQITKAMEMVSASKMRRAQAQALASRPYARKLQTTLETIASLIDANSHPLLQEHNQGKDLLVLVSTDKSLAGSLNTNLFRELDHALQLQNLDPLFVIVGQKARQFVINLDYELEAEYINLNDPISYQDSLPISSMLIKGFLQKKYKTVQVVYMDFISTLVQKYRMQQLLPIPTTWDSPVEDTPTQAPQELPDYIFEPSSNDILNWLLPYYIELTIYQILLESRASEHSARMVAMKNASENAGDIIYDLTLSYNKSRQAAITAELLDITTASLTT